MEFEKDTSKYVPNKPVATLAELYGKSEMFLVNLENMCFDYVRTSGPHYQFISGASARPPQPLPENIERSAKICI